MSFLGDYYLRQPHLPPFKHTHVREYWTASNGVFVRAQREGLAAVIPVVSTRIPIQGLFPLRPSIDLAYPPVSREIVETLLRESWGARDPHTSDWREILFYLYWKDGHWHWTKPEQEQRRGSVTPLAPYEQDMPAPVLDVHSHHTMPPFFSVTDCADDYGFRINGVWGNLDSWPTILVRLGIYGHYYPLRAARVFDLPPFVRDGSFGAEASVNLEEAWFV
jgi:hypothetical protein